MSPFPADPVHPQAWAAASLRLVQDRSVPSHKGESLALPARALDLDRDFSRTFAAIGAGAARARIHALHPARPGDEGAATGFAFALLAHLAANRALTTKGVRRPILWVQDRFTRYESGRPYGLGLDRFGLDPSQFVIVSTKTALDALAAAEIGLEIGGLDGVIAELPPTLPADMLALGKRLALRSERSVTPCLLLHASAPAVPAPVATRWQIASAPAVSGMLWDEPLPVVDLSLIKNRFGPTGRWSLLLARPPLSPSLALGVFDVSDVRAANLPPPAARCVDAVPADRSRAAPAQPCAA